MSRWYTVESTIALPFSRKTVTDIFYIAEKKGFSFFEKKFTYPDYFKEIELPLKEAVDFFYNSLCDKTLHIITLKYQTTIIDLVMNGDNASVWLMFQDFRCPWYIIIDDEEVLDMVRYTYLILDLLEDFPLVDLHVVKS